MLSSVIFVKYLSQVVFILQDCHKPPVTEDVNDPRFVWYCCKCAKNLKKIVSFVSTNNTFAAVSSHQ